jgi:ribosomal protein L21E
MNSFQKGDQVKLILDKQKGPDTHLHGQTGEIIDVEFDDAQSVTGNSEDNFIYTIQLKNGDIPDIHFRRHDLKPIREKDSGAKDSGK